MRYTTPQIKLLLTKEEILKAAAEVIAIEAQSILNLQGHIAEDFYKSVIAIHQTKGRVVVTGIGKSAIIGQKMVATFNSTGTPALFMHAADAVHGDLGMIQPGDLVLCISNSGNTPEIKLLIPWLKQGGNLLIAMVGNLESDLAVNADFVLYAGVNQEACPNNLAPTSSTTAQMVMGDALAVCLLHQRQFSADDFAKFHPGGALGKKLYVKVGDIYKANEMPAVKLEDSLQTVILEITSKRLGATAVLDANNELAGIITDGDLRRLLNKDVDLRSIAAKDIMGASPTTVSETQLAAEALDIMRNKKITQIIVADGKKYLGIIHIHDLNREGLIF
ncbi:MAG: KpsF/GutQ family sugar-phosphate isomerase [Bacteroidetes bacterium]|nr:KpsF/GutQ family sugar-phosphate isomerase [Bacteroidota bacterium]